MLSITDSIKKILIEGTSYSKSMTAREILRVAQLQSVKISQSSLYSHLSLMIGRGLVVRSEEGYAYVGNKPMDDHEVRFLSDAILSSRILTEKKTKELLKKISSIIGKASYQEVCNFEKLLASQVKAENERIYITLNNILRAIQEKSQIIFKMKYYDINGCEQVRMDSVTREPKVYIITPLSFFMDSNLYYLIGFDDQKQMFKHFRLDRMIDCDVHLCNRDEKGPSLDQQLDIKGYLSKCFFSYGGGTSTKGTRVKLRCSKNQLIVNKLIDKFGKDGFKLRALDGVRVIVEFEAFINEGLVMWLLMAEAHIEVLEPLELRETLIERVRRLAQLYNI